RINAILNHKDLRWVKTATLAKRLSITKIIKSDYTFRVMLIREMQSLLELISWLDVYLTVAKVARERGFIFADALPADQQLLQIRQLYHPSLENAVGNTINLDQQKNVLFLTGANM